MSIHCRCESCGKEFNVGEQHAGKRIKCPTCSGVVKVPATGDDGAGSGKVLEGKPPAAPAIADRPASAKPAAPPVKAKPPMAAAPVEAKPKPPLAAKRPSPKAAVDAGSSAAAKLVVTMDKSPANSIGRRRKKKSNPLPMILLGGLGVLGLLVLVGVLAAFAMFSDATPPDTDSSGGRIATGGLTHPAGTGILVLDWPDADRRDATLLIDGKEHAVPPSGAIEIALPPGEHDLTILRRGYEQIDYRFALEDGRRLRFMPRWRELLISGSPTSGTSDRPFQRPGLIDPPQTDAPGSGVATFDDWLQDFEEAKRVAAETDRDILVFFDASDSCTFCRQISRNVFLQRGFRDQVDRLYVLVHIDFPEKEPAKSLVQAPERNQRLAEWAGVDGYPTILVADQQGRPYYSFGFVEDLDEFLRQINRAAILRDQRDTMFRNVEFAEGAEKLRTATQAAALLRHMEVIQFYEPQLREWLALAEQHDPQNAEGLLVPLFALHWLVGVERAKTDKRVAGLDTAGEQLADWAKRHPEVKGNDLALMYAELAVAYHELKEPQKAQRSIDQALACNPDNPTLRSGLKQFEQALKEGLIGVLAFGTGFVVAEGGYILTNQHVINEGDRVQVRIPGVDLPASATVLAKDEDRDMALLRLNHPDELPLKPLRIASDEVHRGMAVAAFGYPMTTVVGSSLKLTTGIVSSTAAENNNRMHLLDCRINPGNSGGPLCNNRGEVVGMVTAKSLVGGDVDSYGMALPTSDLVAFLDKHLPGGYQPLPSSGEAVRLDWDQVDRIVGGSVVMIQIRE